MSILEISILILLLPTAIQLGFMAIAGIVALIQLIIDLFKRKPGLAKKLNVLCLISASTLFTYGLVDVYS